jgi:hypothetical protein
MNDNIKQKGWLIYNSCKLCLQFSLRNEFRGAAKKKFLKRDPCVSKLKSFKLDNLLVY